MDKEKGDDSDEALVQSENDQEEVCKPKRSAWLSLLGASITLVSFITECILVQNIVQIQ